MTLQYSSRAKEIKVNEWCVLTFWREFGGVLFHKYLKCEISFAGQRIPKVFEERVVMEEVLNSLL